MRSIALDNPINAGNLTVPPSIKGTPAITKVSISVIQWVYYVP
jgi:hypothetical protein